MSARKSRQPLLHYATLSDESLAASDIWLVPRNGRVVFDARGNSTWQWPGQDDPFSEHGSLDVMNAADLRIAEPNEIRRSQLPWVHESERSAREFTVAPTRPRFATTSLHSAAARKRSLR